MSNNSSNNKRIVKNSAFLYIRMLFVLLVSLYTTRVVLNTLGIVDYGIYNVVAGFVSLFTFLNNAFNNTIQRFYNFDRSVGDIASLRMTYNTALRIQLMLAVIIFVLLESFGLWYINNKMVIPIERLSAALCVFHFSVLSLVVLVMQIPYSAAIISHEKMDIYAIVNIIDVLLKLSIVLALPYVTYDKLIFYGILSLLVSLLNFFLYYSYSKTHFEEICYKNIFDKKKFSEMLSFSGWNLFGAFAFTIQGQGLNVLINAFFGPVVNAARGVAFQIQGAINSFSENVSTAFRPQLVESYAKKEYKRTCSLMYSMSKFCFVTLYILSLPIIIELQNVLNLWLKGTIPEYTISFTYLILANMLISCLNMPLSQTVQATGKVKYYQVIRSVLVTGTLPVAWVCLCFGASPISVFWVTLIITILNQPLSMIILHRLFPYSYMDYLKNVIVPCFVFLVITPIFPLPCHYLLEESFLRLFVVGVVSIISSLFTTYCIVFNANERIIIKRLIKNKLVN